MFTNSNNKPLIIAISGVTCGGKTTLANQLLEKYPKSVVIPQDAYFYPADSPKQVKVVNMDHHNHDILSSLDMERMHNDILDSLSKNKDIDLLIIEGFIVLNYEPIAAMSHLKYQFYLTREVCLKRRTERFYEIPDLPGYFDWCVWPEYCNYMKELKLVEGITYLDGERDDLFDAVVNDIKLLLKK